MNQFDRTSGCCPTTFLWVRLSVKQKQALGVACRMIAIALQICLKTQSSQQILPTMSSEMLLDSIEWSYEMSYYHLTNLYYRIQKLSDFLIDLIELSYFCLQLIHFLLKFELQNMSEPFTGTQTELCQVCKKQALFECSQCHNAFYCSREHQFEHWKQSHKQNCSQTKAPSDDIEKKILEIRKSYYENFSHKQFSQCLLDAKVMIGFQRKRLLISPSPNYELDYGGTVCLLAKTYLLLNDKKSAKQELQNYMKQKGSIIEDMSDVPNIKLKESVKEKYYDLLQKKLNLISCIGNLFYAIGVSCISYYVLYTKIIMTFFGPESYQASNCYFLIGCYYAEEGYFRKAIECFKKSANIRGQLAGDCFFNIGILYKLQGQLPKALQILEKALKLREAQYGEDSTKVAEINEIMGIIYTELNDFKTAMIQYEKAFQLRSSEPNSPQFENILDLIHELYDKLSLFIESGQPKVKKPDIYLQLQMNIRNTKHYWQNQKYKKKLNENFEEKENKKAENYLKKDEEKQKPKVLQRFQHSLILNEDFTSKLGLAELFRLSELQLELEKCQTQFAVIYTIGTSPFYQNLTLERYNELQKDNKRLFQLIKLEELKKIKNSEA